MLIAGIFRRTCYFYQPPVGNYAQMTPLFVDSFGRLHQQPPKGAYLANQFGSDGSTLFPMNAFHNHDSASSTGSSGVGAVSIPLQAQSFTQRYQTPMYDPNFQFSMSAPARMPIYPEYLAPMMAMPIPQQLNGPSGHPGLFRVSSAAPATTSLEPASGPQRSISARPALETPSTRRPTSLPKEEAKKPLPVKTKPTGVAFPAYVDRVQVPDEWKSIYESGNDLPSGFSRPPYDYAGLIGRVLLEGGGVPRRMTVAELFYALINKYPFYMAHPRLLYNGLRHNLTGCEALIKADRQWGDQASSRYWTIKPGCESCFGTGYYVRDSAKAGAKARKAASLANAELANPTDNTGSTSTLVADHSDGVASGNKPRVIPYSAKPDISRRPAKKVASSPAIASAKNALELTGLSESARQPLGNKTNSSNRKSRETSSPMPIDVDEYDRKPVAKQRNTKKIAAVNAKNLKAYPYCVTLPSQSGMVFANQANIGGSAPAPVSMIQYGTSENYMPAMRPMPLHYPALESNIVPQTAGNLSSLSELAISTNNSHVKSHVSESSASDSEMTSPGDSSLASAMDFTLVRRRSQEELQAAMRSR